MKKLFTLLSLSFSLSPSLVKADYWTQKADYPGAGHSRPYFFSINQKGYAGCGTDQNSVSDFWEYDPSSNAWIAKTPFPGGNAHSGTSFSIANKGYAGMGWIQNTVSEHFWEYDPAINAWSQIADYQGGGRQCSFSFVIGNKGYVGTGFNTSVQETNDFYEYDPANNLWTQKADFAGGPRVIGTAFSIDAFGYAGGGQNNSVFQNDFYKYDPASDSWSPIVSYPGDGAVDMPAFSIANYGYAGLGQFYPPANTVFDDFWQYNPATNQWNQKTSYLGSARDETAYFSIGSKGYIGLGGLNGPISNIFYFDFWEYTPDSTTAIEEFQVSGFGFQVSPNPAKDFITISSTLGVKEKTTVTITDVRGRKVYETKFLSSDFRLPTSDFQKGIYLVTLDNGKQKAVKKFVKE